MSGQLVDLSTWPRAVQYRLFRGFEKPHFAVTSRVDVSHLVARKVAGVSPYRACLYAIGKGLHAVPELRMRFRDDAVFCHDIITLSMTVPTSQGSFGFAYLPFLPDRDAFDIAAKAEIEAVASGAPRAPNQGGRNDFAYLSCMPWLDYTSISNALPGRDDCIPRVTWGKFVDQGGRWDMAMTIEVHHALVDGAQVGEFFAQVQAVLDKI